MNNKIKGILMMLPIITIIAYLFTSTYMRDYELYVVMVQVYVGFIVIFTSAILCVIGIDKLMEK